MQSYSVSEDYWAKLVLKGNQHYRYTHHHRHHQRVAGMHSPQHGTVHCQLQGGSGRLQSLMT